MSKLPAWCVGLATLLLLVFVCLWDYYPPLAGPRSYAVVFQDLRPGECDPLIVTGAFQSADFFGIRCLDTRTIVFKYDSWGHGGPESSPITISPGRRYSLEVDLPSLAAVPTNPARHDDHLRVIFDGRVVLDGPVNLFERRTQQAWFARNPLTGSSWNPSLHGQLFDADGRPCIGTIGAILSFRDRLDGWLEFGRWQIATIVLFSLAIGWGWSRLARVSVADVGRAVLVPGVLFRTHRVFAISALLCLIAFAVIITDGTFRFIYPESFGNFYDYQALSFLQGRLDVPEGCLSGEAFLYGGKAYGYFGPTPALLRLPAVIFSVGFGKLSRIAMFIYYAVTLIGGYALLRHAIRTLRPQRPEPASWEIVLFTIHLGLGSTLFFLGSRAYIYHEAILCGVMFAVWSCWCSFRFLAAPASRWWLAALALGVLSIHARPPVGLFALLFLAACAVLPAWPQLRARQFALLRRPLAIAVLAGVGVVSFNALSYAKFHTIEGCPLRLNVQYTAKRLAKIDAKQFHLANIPYGLDSYFLRPKVVLRSQFPWLYCGPVLPPEAYPGAKLDLPDYTLAFPVGMTGLFLLSTVGCACAARRQPGAALAVVALWAAFVPLTLAMCAAIATAERYTGDFLPFFVCAGAVGLAFSSWGRFGRVLLVLAAIWSCALTLAMTVHYQGQMIWGVPPEVQHNYELLRGRVDNFFSPPPAGR